ncbi:hypothetical protein BCR44DRAFT_1018195 [Catenaria anguillulae PL171]|uniref:Uncharacterized protein n=1 Tax=Catenaria anguillulae PL171 TaxID=765915 RepID=A0A1Y2H6I2_9FUNG|nr:hypothetical protein BCR44DRAFT_1018195 [Catenaria anguillulae PL171]
MEMCNRHEGKKGSRRGLVKPWVPLPAAFRQPHPTHLEGRAEPDLEGCGPTFQLQSNLASWFPIQSREWIRIRTPTHPPTYSHSHSHSHGALAFAFAFPTALPSFNPPSITRPALHLIVPASCHFISTLTLQQYLHSVTLYSVLCTHSDQSWHRSFLVCLVWKP